MWLRMGIFVGYSFSCCTACTVALPQVELWCPKDGNPLRQMLGTLKKVADPIDLKVYRNVVSDGRVYVRVYEGEM